MGFCVSDDNYDYIVAPDFIDVEIEDEDNLIIVASHKNVTRNVIERVKNRYELLEDKLCLKH